MYMYMYISIYIYIHVYIYIYICVVCLFDPPKLLNPSLLKDENLLIQFCG